MAPEDTVTYEVIKELVEREGKGEWQQRCMLE